MGLKECYTAIGGNYEEVLGRLSSEKLVKKFVVKFLSDGSYDLLQESMKNENYEEAFRAAHTIKGICQNLSFGKLYESSHAMAEELRAGRTAEAAGLMGALETDYLQTTAAIRELLAEDGEV